MRREDWPARLAAAIADRSDKAWSWGAHDCCITAADLVLAMTGADPAKGIRGKYKSARGARSMLQRHGGDAAALAASIAVREGWPRIAVSHAQRGDLVACDGPEGPALGIVDLSGQAALVADKTGFGRVPLRLAVAAWRVR